MKIPPYGNIVRCYIILFVLIYRGHICAHFLFFVHFSLFSCCSDLTVPPRLLPLTEHNHYLATLMISLASK